MNQDELNKLLFSILQKWENDKSADAILNDKTGELALSAENQEIFEKICANIDKSAKKLTDLENCVAEGGTRDQWIEDQFSDAFDKINATDEQKCAILEIVDEAYPNVIRENTTDDALTICSENISQEEIRTEKENTSDLGKVKHSTL